MAAFGGAGRRRARCAGSASPTTRPGGSSGPGRSPTAQGVEPFSALQLTTSYVEPRPGAAVPGKDHRFGFVTDETVDYLATHPDLELWVYSPLVQGSYDRADRPFPAAYDHPGTTARLAALTSVAAARGVRPVAGGAGLDAGARLEADRRRQHASSSSTPRSPRRRWSSRPRSSPPSTDRR